MLLLKIIAYFDEDIQERVVSRTNRAIQFSGRRGKHLSKNTPIPEPSSVGASCAREVLRKSTQMPKTECFCQTELPDLIFINESIIIYCKTLIFSIKENL